MAVIEIDNITKDYGNNKGVFDLSFCVNKGEVFGFLGPNGAGKTTTIRQLMGFLNSDKGKCTISGKNCRTELVAIHKTLGYLPGEIAFFDEMTGNEYLKFIADLYSMTDFKRMNELIKAFELDPSGRIKKMSKGMKQKVGIVSAFMHSPDVLILDEPTSGLDPLMQSKFVELIEEEKSKGKTILMSSHSFDEVEKTCDRVGIIKDGRLVAVDEISILRGAKKNLFVVTFATPDEAQKFSKSGAEIASADGAKVTVNLEGKLSALFKKLSEFDVTGFEAKTQSLEELFMHFYGGDRNDK